MSTLYHLLSSIPFSLLWKAGIVFLLFIFFILTVSAQNISPSVPEYTLELVQVVHRHGARSPITSYNSTQICGLKFPCGILNQEGQVMLVRTGEFLRQRYANASEGVVTIPFFKQEEYNLSISTSRSTDVLRTLQSSDAFLRGFFPDLDFYYPAIHTVQDQVDYLLKSSSIPEVAARLGYGKEEEAKLCDPLVDALFPDFSTLQAVGAEVYSAEFCADKQTRTSCAKQLCDIGKAYDSTGELTSYPLLNMNLGAVCAVLSCSSAFAFGYHPNEADVSSMYALDAARGSFGQPLAQRLLTNINEHIENPTFKLFEYSAHDTTITPLGVTFGAQAGDMLLPPFGATFVLELLKKNTSNAVRAKSVAVKHSSENKSLSLEDDEYAVRLLYGHPGETPETNFTFAFADFSLRCLNPLRNDGMPYVATDNICPLSDFVRFINISAPKDPRGLCLVTPSLLTAMDCAPENNTKVAPNSVCLNFRRRCPEEACADGFVMSYNSTCVTALASGSGSINERENNTGISVGLMFFFVIVAFFLGGVASYFLHNKLWCFERKEAREVQIV